MTDTAADTRFWDRAARKYATDPIKDMAGYERTVERTRNLLRATDSVLELGCGTGTTALRLAPSVACIVASDVSAEMITIAREKAAVQAITNIAFEVATPDTWPWPEQTFDAVLAFNVLHLIVDRASTYARVHRLLRPGGLFITKTPCLGEMNPLIRLALPVARAIGKAPTVKVFRAKDIEQEIAAAGFTIVERARHGTARKDPRIFIFAQKQD